ncbi:ATP-binding protein [Vibrio sp. 99-70-13A1]|uniref:sensor histidine kinase n=1 Tax=Vibrio sp. 99-70-13A1 TaxID=2607601 RepID=UPI001493C011|nr:ATP-binding protein [Vibrio sp. 99-70-13A1]NOH95433.1 sensor histidine kinase [Vibrio sp. 99-70-13A1]
MTRIQRFSGLLLLVYGLFCVLGGRWVWQYNHQQLLSEHQSQLDRFSAHITSQLDKFAHIPELLSKDKELIDALLAPENSAQIELTNRYLKHVNSVIHASDTYLIDKYGTTLASSNWQKERSFVSRNFAFRPYFKEAIQGNESQYFALGSTSGQRGYYYAYPVSYAAEIVGVVVVKMDLSSIEKNWKGKQSYFVANDKDQVIFMSSNPKWLFKSLQTLESPVLQRIKNSRQYLNTEIESLNLSGNLEKTSSVLTSKISPAQGKFFVSSRQLEQPKLTIRVLTPTHLVWWDLVGYLVILSLVFAVLFLIFQLLEHRRQKLIQIEKVQEITRQKLEFQVLERTSELHAEVHQRAKTEQALRQTQDELIQAAKLAVLGQMSASISHELNNPLAAIRSYADNGRLFLEKGKAERVDDNLSRISGLTERMAKISQQLKSFARKSSTNELNLVQFQPIVSSAKELMKPQLKTERVTLEETPLDMHVSLLANPIQLEQVLINLLTNAIQAMENQNDKLIVISQEISTDKQLLIHIDDNGPGIESSKISTFFEPFHTTKKNGLGLGLSLSQQIVETMNGQLTACNSSLGGARFTISLPTVKPDDVNSSEMPNEKTSDSQKNN